MSKGDNVNNNLTKLVPEVGMGATEQVGSDRYPYTIQEVNRGGQELVLTMDDFIRTDSNGLSESQEYTYVEQKDGIRRVFTRRKDGRYRLKGTPSTWGGALTVGVRRAYRDPSF